MTTGKFVVLETPQTLASRAADAFEAACSAAVAARGRFAVALSGGKTPRAMLETLAGRALDWQAVHVFWSDERCVPPVDNDSNFKMAREALLEKVNPPMANVHRMRGELAPDEGASEYSRELLAFFGGLPVFDLVFLGLGPDGHTASLFPGTPGLHVTDKPCVANHVGAENVPAPWRLTLTYPAINAARHVMFLVDGADKSAILCRVAVGPQDVERYPAQGIAPTHGDLTWLVDAAAAAQLPHEAFEHSTM